MKNRVLLWYLYDFANSFASIVLIFYFPLIISEKGINESWIGISTSIATGLMLLFLPYFGVWSDKIKNRLFFLKACSWIIFASLLLLAYSTNYLDSDNTFLIVTSFALYILFLMMFQSSYVFYTAQLKDLSDENTNIKVSGNGNGLGQVGNILGLLAVMPVIGGGIIFLGLQGKSLTFFIGALLFIILSSFFLYQKQNNISIITIIPTFSYRQYLVEIFGEKKIFYYLVGYALLADALLTFQLYTTIYFKNVFDLSDKMVSLVGIVGLFFAIVGAFLSHTLVMVTKSKNRAMLCASIIYAVAFILCALSPKNEWAPFLVMIPAGLGFGFLFSISRVIYSDMTPRDEQAKYFSIYTIFERSASVIGPLLWVASFALLSSFGKDIQYRGSVLILFCICIVGVYYLQKSFSLKSPSI